MIDSIGPVVPGDDEERGIGAAHIAGGALGGAATGLTFATAGYLLLPSGGPQRWATALLATAVLAFLYDLLQQGRRIGSSRQTPQRWRHALPASVAAFLNGADLGLGWSTRIYLGSFVVVVIALLLGGDPIAGSAVGAAFGAARSLFVVVFRRSSDGSLAIDRLETKRGLLRGINTVGLGQFIGTLVLIIAM